jgi:hypothetical protein
MFRNPAMAHKSEIGLPRAIVRPRNHPHDGSEDRKAEDDRDNVHRQISSVLRFPTEREYPQSQRRACAERHSRIPSHRLPSRSCQHGMAIERASTKTGNASYVIGSAFKR